MMNHVDQKCDMKSHLALSLQALILAVQCRHRSHQDVGKVASHVLAKKSERRHSLVHLVARHRHQLQLGQRVQSLFQLATVEEVKEGGKVEEEEQGGSCVPSSFALVPIPGTRVEIDTCSNRLILIFFKTS